MSLTRLTLLVLLLLGGTAWSVASYVDSCRPLAQVPVAADQQTPVLSSGPTELAQPDPEDEELDSLAT